MLKNHLLVNHLRSLSIQWLKKHNNNNKVYYFEQISNFLDAFPIKKNIPPPPIPPK